MAHSDRRPRSLADPALDALLAPFLDNPARAGILTDFDGTLAQIVDDPDAARPVPGAVLVLHQLARSYRRVAVISGRPAAFLIKHLALAHDELTEGEAAGEGLIVAGLYGLETGTGGEITVHPDCERWQPVIDRVADEADEQAPPEVYVERKGLTVTLHYRTAPQFEDWAAAWAADVGAREGLRVHPGRMSHELMPPIATDKGTVARDLSQGLDAVCFLGDDVGDLPALRALDDVRADGVAVLKVVVRSDESAPELLDAADVLLDSPLDALALLRRMLPAPPPVARPASAGEDGQAPST
jgi:trehalose 6-phosphate phosphatase